MLFLLPLFPPPRATPIVPHEIELGRAYTTVRNAGRERVHLLWGSKHGIACGYAERMLVVELQTENGRTYLNEAIWHQSGQRTKTFDMDQRGKAVPFDNLAAFLSAFAANREPESLRNLREVTYSRETLMWTIRQNERFVEFALGVACARGEYRPGKVTAPILEDPAYRSLDLTPEDRVLRLTDPSTVTL